MSLYPTNKAAGLLLALAITLGHSHPLYAAEHGGMGGRGGFPGGGGFQRSGATNGMHFSSSPHFTSTPNFNNTPHFNSTPHFNNTPTLKSTPSGNFSVPHFNNGGLKSSLSNNFTGINRSFTSRESQGNLLGNANVHNASHAFDSGANTLHFNKASNPWHFTSGNYRHPVNPANWQHNADWHPGDFDRDHHRDFDDYRHFHDNFFPFVGLGLWWDPWWANSLYYNAGYYPYSYYYGNYDYQPASYITTYPIRTEPSSITEEEPSPTIEEPTIDTGAENDWSEQFLSSARDAFQKGEYSDALRLASHAAIETPKSAASHELMALALFALQDYRGANLESHAALSLGPAAAWETLYGYYNDLPVYTKQLNALKKYIGEHEDAADARFVLAYHEQMMGHKDSAKKQYEKVLALVPQDKLAAKLLKDLGGVPPTVTPPDEKTSGEKTSVETTPPPVSENEK